MTQFRVAVCVCVRVYYLLDDVMRKSIPLGKPGKDGLRNGSSSAGVCFRS